MFARRTYIQISLMTGAMMLVLSAWGQPAPGEVPAGLKRFYHQTLTFGSCEGYATTSLDEQLYVKPFECSRLEVPLDYGAP